MNDSSVTEAPVDVSKVGDRCVTSILPVSQASGGFLFGGGGDLMCLKLIFKWAALVGPTVIQNRSRIIYLKIYIYHSRYLSRGGGGGCSKWKIIFIPHFAHRQRQLSSYYQSSSGELRNQCPQRAVLTPPPPSYMVNRPPGAPPPREKIPHTSLYDIIILILILIINYIFNMSV